MDFIGAQRQDGTTGMTDRVTRAGLQVARELADFIEQAALPGTGVEAARFWDGFAAMLADLTPTNRALLARRAELQARIDQWHIARRGQPHDPEAYFAFLQEIGYLIPEGEDFQIDTAYVDPEIATVPGPQLVVPITNARFAINAANARWGSLYDALYGTDAMGVTPPKGGYDRGHGARVVARARVFLDDAFPIKGASHGDVSRYSVQGGALMIDDKPLESPEKFAGYRGPARAPDAILLVNHGLHVELVFDRAHPIGSRDRALLADVRLESAVSAIMDCEDSVACVDAEDKVLAYGNWLGLMKGDLEATFDKGGKPMTRRLEDDLDYTAPDGKPLKMKGRALMLIRNVGHLMTNPAILDADGNEVFEGLMDAAVTTLIAMHDLRREGGNSLHGSVYVVKPKMHGPDEVAFADQTFTRVEAHAWLAATYCKDWYYGRGAADFRQPQGVHPRCSAPGRLHQHRLSRPYRRRNPHVDGGGAVFPQGLHQAQVVDHRLRESERRYRAGVRVDGAGADRQGHVGDARHDGSDVGTKD
jgi:malate synthase